MSYSHGLIIVSLASICRKLNSTETSSKQLGLDDNVHTYYLVKVFISFSSNLDFCLSRMTSRRLSKFSTTWNFVSRALSLFYRITYLSTTEHTICKHIQVYLLTWLGWFKMYFCFLFSYYETSFVIFLNLMICGRLQGVSCKQTIFDYVVQLPFSCI